MRAPRNHHERCVARELKKLELRQARQQAQETARAEREQRRAQPPPR